MMNAPADPMISFLPDLDNNPLVLAFGDGEQGLPADARASLTVHDAFDLSDSNEDAMRLVILRVFQELTAARELSPAEVGVFMQRVEYAVRIRHHDPLVAIVAEILQEVLSGTAPKQPDPFPDDVVARYNSQRSCADRSSICHAPSTSMFFGRDGVITACCYTRYKPFGRWPDRSLASVWFGPEIDEMRGYMRRNIMPHGCESCAMQLRAGNFTGLLAGNFDYAVQHRTSRDAAAAAGLQAPAAKAYPVRMEFELSNECNLECDMCNGKFSSSIRANREKKPPLAEVYDDRLIEQLREFIPHLREAKFLGGEPFLIDIYSKIWDLITELNPECEISITTNGTALSPRILRHLEQLNFYIVVSLDSLHKERYQAIRRNANFERVLANVETLHEISTRRGKSMTFAVCPMVTNWMDVPDLVAFANARNAGVYFNTVFFPEHLSLRSLSGEKLTEISNTLRSSIKNSANNAEARNYRAVADLCRQIDEWCAEKTYELVS